MQVIYTFLATFLVGIANQFLGKLSKIFIKYSVVFATFLAFSVMFISAVYAYVASLNLIVSGIDQTMPEIVIGVWGWVMPSNTTICFTTIVAALHLRFFTKLYFSLMGMKKASADAAK